MASLRELSHGKIEGYKIDPRQITIKAGFNYRDTTTDAAQKHIEWLKASIRERGVDTPIWVENDGNGFTLIDGECRLLALRALWDDGLEVYVPTIVYKGDEAAILAKSLIANGSLPPTQLEFGRAAERLLAYGWTVKQVAQHTPPHVATSPAKAARYVRDAVELQQAPMAVKAALAHGVEGVAVSPALVLSVTRRTRLLAAEVIKEVATAAKAEGKKVATRPKAKDHKIDANDKMLSIGDSLASACLDDNLSMDVVETLAKAWQKGRKA